MTPGAPPELAARIQARALEAGAEVDDPLAQKLAAYLDLLARWNRKINLTSLEIDPPSDDAIDRLVIEAVVAAKYVEVDETLVLDVGSGGGSPALPLKLALPRLKFVLVESKSRKASFLREAVRHLELRDVTVENVRLEKLSREFVADLAILRAVRVDDELRTALQRALRPSGRVLVFTSVGAGTVPLLPGRSQLLITRV